ncbi:MAG: hypothetical protein O3C03_06880 [Proteobacteria bacterium]|nr:hypothetical protein [Pseudomonadota bacterium]
MGVSLTSQKVWRELKVLGERLLYIPFHAVAPVAQRMYDRWYFPRLKQHIATQFETAEKIAIFLCYTVKSVPVRAFATVDRLRRSGFEVLVVANGGLSSLELKRFNELGVSSLRRPNWGYDFGGYRDGLRLLSVLNCSPSELILMNDSIEYPVLSKDQLIEAMRNHGSDFVGAVHAKPVNPNGNEDYGVIFSFLLWASSSTLRSPAWQDFWARYVMTGSKYATVRRGERALTRAMMRGGLRCGGVYTRDAFLRVVDGLPADELRVAIEHGVYVDDEIFLRRASQLLAQPVEGDEWRGRAVNFIQDVVAKRNFLYSFPYITHGALDVPFVKRSGATMQVAAYQSFLWLVKNGYLLKGLLDSVHDGDSERSSTDVLDLKRRPFLCK